MMHFQRNAACGQAAMAPGEARKHRATCFGVQQQACVATAGGGIGLEQRAHASRRVRNGRIGVCHGARRAHRRAGAAAHAQMRFDFDVISFSPNRLGRAHVDAARAARLLRPTVSADRGVVGEIPGLFELARQRGELRDGLRLRDRVGTRAQVALRRLMHAQLRHALQVEHEIEALLALRLATLEVDGADDAASRDTSAVRMAALGVDLIAPVDRILRTGTDAGVAACAQVQIDRVFLRPFDFEGAQPAGDARRLARKDGEIALGRQLGLRPRSGREHRDTELGRKHARPVQRCVQRSHDQQLTVRLVRDGRHRIGIGQGRRGQQGGDLRRRCVRLLRPAAGFANVYEANGLRAATLLRGIAEQPRLLHASDERIAAHRVGEFRQIALTQRCCNFGRSIQCKRPAERLRVERHSGIARAHVQLLTAQAAHRGASPSSRSSSGGVISGAVARFSVVSSVSTVSFFTSGPSPP
jgi:hypothetical protein